MAGNNVPAAGLTDAPERYPWHENLWSTLAGQFERLPHALMLHGRPGLGKHAFAVQLSRALLCTGPRAGEACGKCQGCRLFASGTHPDFHVLRPEAIAESSPDLTSLYAVRYPASDKKRERLSADITIYQIRSLIEDIQIRPYIAHRKVVLLSPAEAMNAHAANSLLKLLEEPPLGSMLLLVTSHPARLPATIRSRCSHILFKSPALMDGLAWLQARPGAGDQPQKLLEMARGAPLLAEALAQDGFAENRVKLINDLAALRSGREEPVACAARWKAQGTRRVLGWLYGFMFDAIKIRMGAEASALINPEAASVLKNDINKYKISELYNLVDVILKHYRLLGGPLDELLILEDVLIRWTHMSRLQ